MCPCLARCLKSFSAYAVCARPSPPLCVWSGEVGFDGAPLFLCVSCDSEGATWAPLWVLNVGTAMSAGALATFVGNPFDVALVRMQVPGTEKQRGGIKGAWSRRKGEEARGG